MDPITLDQRKIGSGQPCFVIAEAGVNHNGDVGAALELVRAAKQSGADCVKFQTFKAERVVTTNAPKAAYQLKVTDPAESQLDMLRKLELSESAHRAVIRACRETGIIFLSTPYSIEDAVFLAELGAPGFKIASGQIAEPSLLAAVARFGRPVILSTGMSTLQEIADAAAAIRSAGNESFAVLQCTTNYPSAAADANLRAMTTIRSATKAVVGYSDHTEGFGICLGAVALGACIIEKHFTLDRNLAGPDHRCSSDPAEFAALVRGIRDVEAALGDGVKTPTAAELANLTGMRRSIVTARRLKAGELVTAEDFTFKRPATGLAPRRLPEIVGRTTRVDIPADSQVDPGQFK